ncbi:bacterial proteasome activator family protein [Intrasporangium flavum]|uniref:bacterial proteasome activator family protein n=1 Tax=Intrasporangium flavum TaxID=1428657 RepID=UPI00096DD0E0|nr:bacterial proteasome activator family protein [Intrasporangium flavum]
MSDDATTTGSTTGSTTGQGGTGDEQRVVVVTPDGMGVSATPVGDASDGSGERRGHDRDEREPTNPADLVEEPAKVMRIGSMIKQLLEEVRNAPLDAAGRRRLAEIHHRSIEELKDGLAPELVAELDRIALPFREDEPSDAELRIAQAQLVGWLEGLFHGIQTALVAQQMAAQQQLQQMRALPPGPGASYGTPPGLRPHDGSLPPEAGDPGPTGQYL